MIQSMKKLCSRNDNLNDNDHENELEMVLEVSMPEEVFTKTSTNAAKKRWQHLFNLVRPQKDRAARWLAILSTINDGPKDKQFMYFLKIVGTSFIPLQVQLDHALSLPVRDGSIEASRAKYIVQQYIAATGGVAALNSVSSMYVVGQVNIVQGQIQEDGQENENTSEGDGSESGAFMFWQKSPNLWYLELVVSSCKVSAGSDGTVTWSQSSLNPSQSSKGPPRPLRRFFQGLDPRSTVNLFLNAVFIGEKVIMKEDCFILKLEVSQDILKAQSKQNMETEHHTIRGYFSQRTGLLVQFEDTKLVRIKSTRKGRCDQFVYYETSMESSLEEYRLIEGVNMARYGKTGTSIYRYGQGEKTRWNVEETCRIKEIEFNVSGLAKDSFLPPPDVKTEEQGI